MLSTSHLVNWSNAESTCHTAPSLKGLSLYPGGHAGALPHHCFHLPTRCHHKASLCTASLTRDFQPTRKRETTPLPYHLCTDLGYIPLCYAKYQYLAFKASLDGHKKHRAPHQTSPKQSINRGTFLQHLCIHKASAVLFHPMNTSCCTVPPTKLENSSWGVKPQLKWLSTVQAQASQQDNGPRE